MADTASLRRLAFAVHSWVGLKLAVVMSFVLVTGTLATVAHDIDWLMRPALRAAPQDGTAHDGPARYGAIHDAVRAADPAWTIEAVEAPVAPWFAAVARVRDRDNGLRFVYADPATGRVQGDGSWITVQRVLRNTHRHLMLPTRIGVPLVSALALPLLASLVTGLIVYRKWWRGLARAPRGGPARRTWGDVHRLAGVWSLAFVALMAATGLWYLVESLGGDAPLPRPPRAAAGHDPGAIDGAAVDRAIAAAGRALPGLEVFHVALPGDGAPYIIVQGQLTAALVRDRANAVAIDPATGRVAHVLRGEDLGLHQRLSEAADPLHFGTWGGRGTGGFFVRLVWFAFGALLSALALSGVYLYGARTFKTYGPAQNHAGPWRLAWGNMRGWRWLGVAAAAVSVVMAPSSLAP
ncbi:MAG: PepSY-associated TM helix domain-containing protein [Rhodospirillaceae bacterium]|nr:PepSY-associated TM helix domain-containing protein [Rhodospirillaceae bacterium]